MNANGENDTLMAEIGEAINAMNAEAAGKSAAEGAVKETASAEPTAAAVETVSFSPDDALMERAIKAGLSVADAKAFGSAEQAEKIVAMLEAKSGTPTTETKADANEDGDGFPAGKFDEILKAMEEDKDEEGHANYDPSILGALKEMAALIKSQSKELVALKAAGKSAAAANSFDQAYEGLDKGVRDHVDAATKSQLKAKFDFLKSAHAAAKDGMKDGEVFEEARKLVLGKIESEASAENKAAELLKRKSLALARPGGESGQRGQDRPMTEEDIANALFNALTK